jgi:predicted 2-oxoglutarate/Fe(II)-dependent dioxygenase YbiX
MMARAQSPAGVSVGDPMPRITLPLAAGGLFDSWHPMTWGLAIIYWLGAPPEASIVAQLGDALAACETLLYFVAAALPEVLGGASSALLDRANELGRAFEASGPLAIVVDASGRVAALLPAPTADGVAVLATRLYGATTPDVVRAKAPVLLLDRVVEPGLCRSLVDHWEHSEKSANVVGSVTGNVVNTEVKRRQDVQLDHPDLFVQLRDCLVRRVVPMISQAFHARIMVIEAPIVGCYEAASGGRFQRHRDNSSPYTAHRQFALSINLNADDEYEGGEVRFPEFGRQLYRPAAGGALVFSTSLLHEVVPVIRGRRFGVFTFLSANGPSPHSRPPQFHSSRSRSPQSRSR